MRGAVFTGEVAEVYLERRSHLPGYCIVAWRHGHVAEPADLDPGQPGQPGQYWAKVVAAGRAVRALSGPVKMNYMTLGNTVPACTPTSCPNTASRQGQRPGLPGKQWPGVPGRRTPAGPAGPASKPCRAPAGPPRRLSPEVTAARSPSS
ncbi:MAG TPA: hypothetical protein VI365_06680 [Trebonia sp.]